MAKQTYAFVWYDEANYRELLVIAADRPRLPDIHAEWERRAQSRVDQLTAQEIEVRKVVVDVRAMVAWLEKAGKPVDASGRQLYAAWLLMYPAA